MRNLVWYLLAGTRGGEMRARMLLALRERPRNAHQLSQALGVDYKTVQHHVRVLLENNIITAINKGGYGAVYFLSPELEQSWADFREIWEQVGKKNLKNKPVVRQYGV
jgi:DNA-binding transcriptional ArsR family regulator